MSESQSLRYHVFSNDSSGYSCALSHEAQVNCANIVPKGPISEALGMEEKMMMNKEVKSSYLAICQKHPKT